jgi:hypothetical protein
MGISSGIRAVADEHIFLKIGGLEFLVWGRIAGPIEKPVSWIIEIRECLLAVCISIRPDNRKSRFSTCPNRGFVNSPGIPSGNPLFSNVDIPPFLKNLDNRIAIGILITGILFFSCL